MVAQQHEIVLTPKVANIHRPIFDMSTGTAIFIGGRAGMKTQTVSKKIIAEMCIKHDIRTVVVRDQAVQLKNSILYQIKAKFAEVNAKSDSHYSQYYQLQDRSIKRINVESPYDALFTFGMKGSSNDLESRAKGLEDINTLIMEEAQDIRDYDQVRTLFDTVSRNKPLIIILLNTPDAGHWVIDRYYNLIPTEWEGYYSLQPKRDDFSSFFTTYKDNEFLTTEIAYEYAKYGDPDHPDYDLHHYLTDVLGLVSSGRKGRIFPNIQISTDEEFEAFDGKSLYGIDFGFTNDATTLIHCKVHNKTVHSKELLYQTGLLTADLSTEMIRLGLKRSDYIVADGAEPKTITEMQRVHGWTNLRASVKGANSVQTQISFLNSYNFYDTASSKMLWWENRNYIYAVDNNNMKLNVPDDRRLPHPDGVSSPIKPDNLQDARRYAVYTYLTHQVKYSSKHFL